MANPLFKDLANISPQKDSNPLFNDLKSVEVNNASVPVNPAPGNSLLNTIKHLARNAADFVNNSSAKGLNGILNLSDLIDEGAGGLLDLVGAHHLSSEVNKPLPKFQTTPGVASDIVGNLLSMGATGPAFEGAAAKYVPSALARLFGLEASAGATSPTGDRLKSMLFTAPFGLAGELANAGLRQAAPVTLSDRSAKVIGQSTGNAAANLRGAYQDAVDQSQSYPQMIQSAQNLDSNGVPIDLSQYKQSAQSMLDEIGNKDAATQNRMSDVKNLLSDVVNGPPKDYNGVIEHYQTLNQAPSWETKSKNDMRDYVTRLKSALLDNIENNGASNQGIADFVNNFKQANQDWANVKDFTNPKPLGRTRDTLERALAGADDTAFHKSFIDATSTKSPMKNWERYIQLSGLPADQAKTFIKQDFFRDVVGENGAPSQAKFLDKYGKLGDKERSFLFDNKDKVRLDAAEKAYKKNKNSIMGKTLRSGLFDAISGALLAKSAGYSPEAGAIGGYAISKMPKVVSGLTTGMLPSDAIVSLLNNGKVSRFMPYAGGALGKYLGGGNQ